ncbi:class II fructose-bisphosphate aldolase [Marinitenerispora sediminis]|uniref:Ketose-bisphosphate aldolase n=1 Tax=Marinitenerispora sediminis TaxID=1931232 RepID=A0A368T2M6_9ACTN|nr:class II fructose-bisphosphate aldolase [Marinitenerispora sediminis]RCV55979.1 ketose-bisphosphate aldolase [Marinitenerispora sediminis]RCV56264.1 ketose-bisphosphate aldolase [Marinitenerispora sediminis]RCV61197.1 ketose-bisphosphate aldolase [Marinitenerispora sediminis]
MLTRGTDVLTGAAAERRAVPGFVAYNLETAQAVAAAAELAGAPVLLQAGSSAFRHTGRDALVELALGVARRSAAPIGVHLDHSRDPEEAAACIAAGYTSVMIDGSHLPFTENVELTRAVVRRAHDAGVWVEGELGAIAGDEDVSTDASGGTMTDPGQAAEFVAATGVDALAVSVGNVHGFTSAPVRLDLDRLADIHELVPVPLVLHGASGLPEEQLLGALDRGVAKVNVNAELRRAYLTAVADRLPEALPASDTVATWAAGRGAVRDTALRIIRLLGRAGTEPAP